MTRLQQWFLIMGGIGVALITATMLASAHGGDPSKIHACVVTVPQQAPPPGTWVPQGAPPASGPRGSLRIVDVNEPCAPNQVPMDWAFSGSGLQGPIGPAGPQGPQGLQGPPGPPASNYSIIGNTVACPDGVQVTPLLGKPMQCGSPASQPLMGQTMPAAGTLSNLTVQTSLCFCFIPPEVTVMVRKNGQGTTVTCTVNAASPSTPPPTAQSTCVNDVASVQVAKGDIVGVGVANTHSGDVYWAMKFTPQ
jgi:hypothetical protein